MKINRHILDNGLRLVHSQDESTQMVALNILYNVGARDEDPEHTGFAHLFEHLMFGGSVNIPDYDMPLQLAGGENNAWTNNDITNYYLTVPRQNVETGFWLESDRMLSLDFSERSLEVLHVLFGGMGKVLSFLFRTVVDDISGQWCLAQGEELFLELIVRAVVEETQGAPS